MATNDSPTPRLSADEFLSIIRKQQLGKLKIYIGACAGVGKTYQNARGGQPFEKPGRGRSHRLRRAS